MTFDFTSLISDVAPSLISGGIDLAANSLLNDDIDEATDNFNRGAFEAADRINEGYDEQLGIREQGSDSLRAIIDAGLIDTSTILELASGKYGADLAAVAQEYASQMTPVYDEYGNQINASANLYGSDLGLTEGEAATLLQQGSEGFQDAFDPYVTAGDAGLNEMLAVMGIDPSQLTPSQLRLMEQYTEDAQAGLASSNLRGAGRAGVAAVNEGRAALYADLYDQNQRRKDAAIQTGVNAGINATGQVAGNIQGLGNSLSDLRYKTGTQIAGTKLNAATKVADTGFNLGQDIATKAFDAGSTAASADYNTGQKVSGLTGQYYGNAADIEGNRYQTRGDTAFGKAVNDASALGTVTGNNYAADTNKANNSAQVLSSIGNSAAEAVKGSIDKSRQNDQPVKVTTQGDLPWLNQ